MNILYLHRTQGRGVERVHIRQISKSFEAKGHTVDVLGPVDIMNVNNEKSREPGILKKSFGFLAKYCPEFMFEIIEVCYNFIAYARIKKAFKRNTQTRSFTVPVRTPVMLIDTPQ